MNSFILDIQTKIKCEVDTLPVTRAVNRFYRDMKMVFFDEKKIGNDCIYLDWDEKIEAEHYLIVVGADKLVIKAGDDLGFVYALHYLSENYLGIHPFWFWNDQKLDQMSNVEILSGEYYSQDFRVAYRGWFINDEVLITHWDAGIESENPWEMVFEALLRMGGNLVIPGTDHNSKIYSQLASDMGLWITHHHAEPLGAEMFARVYPTLNPSFKEYPELFRKLWQDGIQRQKKQKIIWNIGFRGQGDAPFWVHDKEYDTPEKRGGLISSIMLEQYNMVRQEVPDAIFCTNLYGEIMELYEKGYIAIPDDVILVWADSGYGKMVSRRQGNHNPRVPAIPNENLRDKNHGTYYHVSFYDLQAANHITMLPNSMEFVEQELDEAYNCGITKLWVINSSNIKPHVYPLDFIANLWRRNYVGAKRHRKYYLKNYYINDDKVLDKMQYCLEEYFRSTIQYGTYVDEKAGEQFYNYLTRYFINVWMKNGGTAPCENLYWCTPKVGFEEQIFWYREKCESGYQAFKKLLEKCEEIELIVGDLWRDSILLQVKIHTYCLDGALNFCHGYKEYISGNYMNAFCCLGEAADWYGKADHEMRSREHDKWEGFYANDCLTDIKETAYCIRMLMAYVRNIGDGPDFFHWQRDVIYSEQDRRVILITNMENHMTDMELYQAMKAKHQLPLTID